MVRSAERHGTVLRNVRVADRTDNDPARENDAREGEGGGRPSRPCVPSRGIPRARGGTDQPVTAAALLGVGDPYGRAAARCPVVVGRERSHGMFVLCRGTSAGESINQSVRALDDDGSARTSHAMRGPVLITCAPSYRALPGSIHL